LPITKIRKFWPQFFYNVVPRRLTASSGRWPSRTIRRFRWTSRTRCGPTPSSRAGLPSGSSSTPARRRGLLGFAVA